jgi:hypothetical protein
MPLAPKLAATLGIGAALTLVSSGGSADPKEFATTIGDQRAVNVTIYNGGYSLVHDRRRVPLEGGINHVAWRDVSAEIEPTSSLLLDLTDPGGASLVEQNFDFDTFKASAIAAKFVGREVTVVHRHPLAGQAQREQAKLLSLDDGIVLQYPDRVETALDDSYLVFPSLPPDLRDRPTLVLDVDAGKGGPQDLDLSYLTNGLGWHAEYTGSVSPDETKLDLSALVTLTNSSGTSYRNARLQLVAGNVNSPQPPRPLMQSMARAAIAPAPKQENFFEYHLYTMPRTTTILDKQTKQIGFLSAHAIPLNKTYELRGYGSYYSSANADLGSKMPVGVYLSFVNKGGDLGVPLPAGLMRFYKTDSGGTSQFLGADSISHTPKNETVRVHLGDAFDVTANKRQTNFANVSICVFDSAYSVTLANAKDGDVDVQVIEPIPGDWQIVSENLTHRKSSSATATWTVHVPKDGHAELTYATRVKVCEAK